MANKITNTDNYTAIANAIRSKNGSSDTYTPSQMATAISNLQTCVPNLIFAYRSMSFVKQYAPTLDVSQYTNMYYMFGNIQDVSGIDKTLDLSSWDVSNVRDMSLMFYRSSGKQPFTSIDITGWDTSKVTDAARMFETCGDLTQIVGLEDLDVSELQRVTYMFSSCSSLTSLDLSAWRPHLTYSDGVVGVFGWCTALSSIDVSGWDVSNCTSLYSTFSDDVALTTIDLSSWNMTATDMRYAFKGCTSLQTLRLDKINMTNASSYNNVFDNVPSSCSIYVKDQANKDWVLARRPDFTNVVIAQ